MRAALLADDLGLPPAYAAAAGFDVLRDEGIAYAESSPLQAFPRPCASHTDAVPPDADDARAPFGQRVLAETAAAEGPRWPELARLAVLTGGRTGPV